MGDTLLVGRIDPSTQIPNVGTSNEVDMIRTESVLLPSPLVLYELEIHELLDLPHIHAVGYTLERRCKLP